MISCSALELPAIFEILAWWGSSMSFYCCCLLVLESDTSGFALEQAAM